MKIFVTGTDGYIGVLLGGYLMERGHEVLGCDSGFYRTGWLYNGVRRQPPQLTKDLRKLTADDVRGFDAICHLAELSNDPVGQLNPTITYEINHAGSVHLANLAREARVPRFVYFSSCSVYGEGGETPLTEEAPVKPLTAYADCKTKVEHDVGAMAGDDFSPTFLRNATAYGASPRQRFDIVVNNLAGWAWTINEIKMESDGTPWRPLVHVLDICQAAALCVEAPREKVHGEKFNVGSNDQNYQVKDLANLVGEAFPGCTVTFGDRGGDKRDYKVNFDKIRRVFPEYECKWDVGRGARQLHDVFERIQLTKEMFESPPHTRLKMIRHLLETGQIDAQFYWQEVGEP